MHERQQNSGWLWSNAKQWVQKQYFKVTHTIDLGLNDQNSDEVWMFGQHCSDNETARLIYSTTLWFTYREKLTFEHSQLTSDVGWGCMLRVGQMMLAQSLRRSQGIQNYSNQIVIKRIVNSFMSEKGEYSIQKMVEKGQRLYHKGAGQWFSPSETAFILRDLQNQCLDSKLKVLVFHNQYQSTSALEYLRTDNKDKKKTYTTSFIKKNKQTIKYNQDICINPGLIIVLVRIGMNSPQEDMLQSILTIMKLNSFVGILGGKPGKAHYIIGTTLKKFIYLDPHCVKEKQQTEQFFCLTMFSMAHQKTDTSMAVCFYVSDFGEFMTMSDALKTLKNNHVFYSYSIVDEPKLVQLNSDNFQVLGQ